MYISYALLDNKLAKTKWNILFDIDVHSIRNSASKSYSGTASIHIQQIQTLVRPENTLSKKIASSNFATGLQ